MKKDSCDGLIDYKSNSEGSCAWNSGSSPPSCLKFTQCSGAPSEVCRNNPLCDLESECVDAKCPGLNQVNILTLNQKIKCGLKYSLCLWVHETTSTDN